MTLAMAIAHCGDSDVRVSTGPGVVPSPGTFNGSLSDGGSIRIEVGSIEEIAFTCDNEEIQETFSPPQPIDSDGTFNVKFSDGGRDFRVQGTFRDNNNVDGTINDEDNECDVSYDASRGGGFLTPTPQRTPTPGGIVPTATTGDVDPTATAPEPTDPNATVTPTPATSGGPTGGPSPCPVGVEVLSNAGTAKVLDTGWTGIAHNATVIGDGKLSFTVACDGTTRPCGVCDVSGPIPNANKNAGDIDAQRCINDTSIKCTDNSACGAGTCVYYFGAPLPLSAGGVSTCVTNQVNGAVSGTANIESGAFSTSITLASRVFTGVSNEQPCPICAGDAVSTPNDGKANGTCSAGARQGQPCDINGRSAVPSFGNTSLDCPPTASALLASLSIPLSGSSGTETKTLTAQSPNCNGFFGPGVTKKCFCEPGGTEPNKPNGCNDGICTDEGGGEGSCEAGPIDSNCSIESFRGCSTATQATDCPAQGDSCLSALRPCYIDNGEVGGSVSVTGKADPPKSGKSNPIFATLFCVPPVKSAASVNTAAGLPGLGRLRLPLATQEVLP